MPHNSIFRYLPYYVSKAPIDFIMKLHSLTTNETPAPVGDAYLPYMRWDPQQSLQVGDLCVKATALKGSSASIFLPLITLFLGWESSSLTGTNTDDLHFKITSKINQRNLMHLFCVICWFLPEMKFLGTAFYFLFSERSCGLGCLFALVNWNQATGWYAFRGPRGPFRVFK